MKVWVLLIMSCVDCDTQAVELFDHAPEEAEIRALKKAHGGMWCLNERVWEQEYAWLAAAPGQERQAGEERGNNEDHLTAATTTGRS